MRILVLTTYDGDEDIHRAIDAGLCYLLKDARREPRCHPGRPFDGATTPVTAHLRESGPRIRLSPRETDVLRLMWVQQQDIATTITEGTVKGYVVTS